MLQRIFRLRYLLAAAAAFFVALPAGDAALVPLRLGLGLFLDALALLPARPCVLILKKKAKE